MTSTILAQKLMSTKLGKCEFERLKWQRYWNASNKSKIAQKLKKILDEQVSLKTCRLCLSPGGEDIFDNKDFDLANNITSILGVQVSQSDGKPQHICSSCKDTVTNAAKLRQAAEVVQWRLQQELELIEETATEWEPEPRKIHGGYFVETETKILREWTCFRCKRVFDKWELFDEHDNKHCSRIEAPRSMNPLSRAGFVCETCGKKFNRHQSFSKHRTTHSDELPYSCPRCPFRSRTKLGVNQHIRHGHLARRAVCPHCPAAFASSSNLAAHKKTHFPPELFCRVCQRGFRFNQALQNHIATQHSKARPFGCTSCEDSFATKKLLRRHEIIAHNRPKLRPGCNEMLFDGSYT